MKLIVGLGNPGDKYESTKHNVGFLVLDHFLKDLESVSKSNWTEDKKLKSQIYAFDYKPKKGDIEKIILARPQTYMNNSGMAVGLIARYYKVKPADVWIVYDELDLPLGFIKIRFGGGTAGHHGLESIMETLGTDKFWRFRMGIGNQKSNLPPSLKLRRASKIRNMSDYVLGGFGRGDRGKVKAMIKRGSKALSTALEKGLESSMNQFNTK